MVTLLIDPPARTTNASAAAETATAINGSGRSIFRPLSAEESEGCVKPTYRNIIYTTLELFKFTIGMGDLEFTERYMALQTRFPRKKNLT